MLTGPRLLRCGCEGCQKDGKDQTYVFYFPTPPDGSVKLSKLTLKGEAKADYKTANAGYKDATVYIFEATPEKATNDLAGQIKQLARYVE